jgi:hypothetical protein
VSGRTVEKWWDQLQRTSDPLRVPIWEGTERKAFSLKERAQIRNDILYLLLITFLRFGELKNGGPSATEFLHRWQIRK